MNVTDLLIIMALSLLIWFWLESMKIKEAARFAGSRVCSKHNVQFLDETVHLSSMKLGKNKHGQIKLLRTFKFEFTNSEYHRYEGELILIGRQLQKLHMDAYRIDDKDSELS